MKKLTIFLVFLLFVSFHALAQMQITGKVTGAEDGLSIPGVSVLVKDNPTIGTTTDFDGKYSLTVPETAEVLIFSFVGMKTQEVTINGRSVIDVQLEAEVLEMDEVVVTAIGIKREAKALGYAVQSVGGEDLTSTPAPSVLEAMNGRVAGVSIISNAGGAGAGSTMLIRGSASLGGSVEPLFIVDGVPIDNSMYLDSPYATEGVDESNRAIDLNSDDIESINILKGGAATTLYGMRASNGVILITTKKGKTGGGLNVNYHTSYSWDKVSQMHPLQDKYAQGFGGAFQNFGGTTFTWGPEISTLRYDGDKTYKYDPVNGRQIVSNDPNLKQVEPFDNVDEYFQTGHTLRNAINISGGNETTTVFASFSNSQSDGIEPNTEFDRTTAKVSAETKIADKLTVGGSANFINSGGRRVQKASNVSGTMLGLLRTPPNFDIKRAYNEIDGTQRMYSSYDNPIWSTENNYTKDNVNRLIGNVNLSYQLLEWLSISYRLGIDTYVDERTGIHGYESSSYPGGQINESRRTKTLLNSDLLVNITKQITDNIGFTAIIGNNLFEDNFKALMAWGENASVPYFNDLSNYTSVTSTSYKEDSRTSAWFGDIGLSYQSMVFINFTGRYEKSTTLPENDNAFLYPSVNGGFVFTELPIIPGNNILSFGKIRASYAVNANIPAAYRTKTYFVQQDYDDGFTNGIDFSDFLGVGGFGVSSVLGYPNLEPELQKNWEVGADLRFFNNRFSVDFTYYDQYNEKLLISVPVASSSGFRNNYLNAGEVENKGIEMLIGATPVKGKKFQWDLLFNFTKNNSKVVKLADGVDEIFQGGFTSAGVFSIAGEPNGSIFGTYFLTDNDGNVVINDDPTDPQYGYPYQSTDRKNVGNVNPDWTLGITNDISYKGFTLSALLDIRVGGQMFNFTKARLYYQGVHEDTETRGEEIVFEGVMGHYDDEGNLISSGQQNNITAVLDQDWYTGKGGSSGVAEPFVEDANWVRLRNITLSYELPNQLLSKLSISSASIYFSGQNLWVSTPYTGIDPESSLVASANARGFEYFNTPGSKSYSLGLKLSF